MIVLDASVMIAHLDAADTHNARATTLLLGLATEPLAASVVSLAEVPVGPTRAGRLDQALALLRQLDVVSIELNANASMRLAMLRAETSLKLPDCCVLLAGDKWQWCISGAD